MSLLKPIDCPRCGAPLPSDAIGAALTVCPYCDGTLAVDPRTVFALEFERALARSSAGDLRIRGLPYVLGRTLGRGASSDVFEGRRARLPSERVVIKIRRDGSFDPELRTIRALEASNAPGAVHFTSRLPQVVALGARDDGAPVLVVRHVSGFDHMATDVRAQHGDTLDARHGAWMLRRLLELLGWMHASGYVHRQIAPEHLIVNARDHGVMLAGWSKAGRITAVDDTERDVADAARTVGAVLGGGATSAIASVLVRYAGRGGTAADAERDIVAAARKDFGPSRFIALRLGN